MNTVKLNTVGILSGGGNAGGGSAINNQEKVVDITENGTTEVVADAGFTGLSKVVVNTNVQSGGGETSSSAPMQIIDNYLTIEALEDGLIASLSSMNCEYCVDGNGQWKSLSAGVQTESIGIGQTLSFRSNQAKPSEGYNQFSVSKKFNLRGNIMSIRYGDNGKNTTNIADDNAFRTMFSNTPVVRVSRNFLPASSISRNCYQSLFDGCTELIEAPDLPAIDLTYYCYRRMFAECSSLKKAPILVAKTLDSYCYQEMFRNATSLSMVITLHESTPVQQMMSNWLFGTADAGVYIAPLGIKDLPYGCTPGSGWDIYQKVSQ